MEVTSNFSCRVLTLSLVAGFYSICTLIPEQWNVRLITGDTIIIQFKLFDNIIHSAEEGCALPNLTLTFNIVFYNRIVVNFFTELAIIKCQKWLLYFFASHGVSHKCIMPALCAQYAS